MCLFIPVAVLLYLSAISVDAQVASGSWRVRSCDYPAVMSTHDWQKPNIATSVTDRVNLAAAALDKAIGMLNTSAQFTGTSSFHLIINCRPDGVENLRRSVWDRRELVLSNGGFRHVH